MKHFKSVKSQNNPGIERFYFIPCGSLIRDPYPLFDVNADAVIIQELPLAPGTIWYEARVTKHTLRYEGSSKLTASGRIFDHKLQGVAAKVTPALLAALLQFNDERFVLIYQDRNNYLRIVGSKAYGLTATFEETSGQQPGDRNQMSFAFEGRTNRPAYFFDGNLINTLAPEIQQGNTASYQVPDNARITGGIEPDFTFRIVA